MRNTGLIFIVCMLLFAPFNRVCALQGEDPGRVKKTVKPPETKPLKPPPVVPPREPRAVRQSRPRPTPYASLTVTGSPIGCMVLINGSVRGTIDSNGQFSLDGLKPGVYTINVRKVGYREAEDRISLVAGQSGVVHFDLSPVPGTLNVTTNVSGAEIGVQNYGNYSDRVADLSLVPGSYQIFVSKPGYRTITREIQVKAGEVLNVPITLEPVPAEELLAAADNYILARNYSQAAAICRGILASNPGQPRANLLMGLSYYYSGSYSESAPYLLKAIALGEQVTIPIRHHHRVFLSDDLCTGQLTIGGGILAFTSTDRPGHDFSVPATSIYDLKFEPQKGGRVHLQVGILKGGKEDKKTYNFHVIHAGTRYYEPNNPNSITVVYCDNCVEETRLLYQLLQQLQQSSPKLPDTNKQKKRV